MLKDWHLWYVDRKQEFSGNAYFNKRRNPSQDYLDLCGELNQLLPTNYYDQDGSGKRVWPRLTERDISTISKFSKEYETR